MLLRDHLEVWFRSRADVKDGQAVFDGGYGSGGVVIDLAELEKELAEAITRQVGVEVQRMRSDKLLTQADADKVYSRLRALFVDPDWMPGLTIRGRTQR